MATPYHPKPWNTLELATRPTSNGLVMIDNATYPNGTPLSLVPIYALSVTLFGKNSNSDTDPGGDQANSNPVYIGAAGHQNQTLAPWNAGETGGDVVISMTDSYPINLQDIYADGENGDGVAWQAVLAIV